MKFFCAGTLQLEVFSYICGGWLLTVKGYYRGASAGEILNPDVRRWVEGLTEDDNGLVRIVDYR